MFGRTKIKQGRALGWAFPAGSTRIEWRREERTGTAGREEVQTVHVLVDGRRGSGAGQPAAPGEGFNFRAVEAMAGMSRVPSLPARPHFRAVGMIYRRSQPEPLFLGSCFSLRDSTTVLTAGALHRESRAR